MSFNEDLVDVSEELLNPAEMNNNLDINTQDGTQAEVDQQHSVSTELVVELPSCGAIIQHLNNGNGAADSNSIGQNCDLKDLICGRFGFDEIIYNHVAEHDFDIESLLVITESEINDLFPVPLLGTRAKFKFHLNLWRRDACTVSVTSSCREWINHISTPTSTQNTFSNGSQVISGSPSSSRASEESALSNTKLIELLNGTEIGAEVLRFYEEKTYLEESVRDILTTLIVDNYSKNQKVMSMHDIVSASDAIQSIFHTECKDYYIKKRGNGLNPTGKLHDKAVNARAKIRNLKKRKHFEIEKTSTTAVLIVPEPETLSETEKESIIWLKHNNEPWTLVEIIWKQLISTRQADIQILDSYNLLKKWPLFKHSLAHTLIDIDNSSNSFTSAK